jgi:hypothetical protein
MAIVDFPVPPFWLAKVIVHTAFAFVAAAQTRSESSDIVTGPHRVSSRRAELRGSRCWQHMWNAAVQGGDPFYDRPGARLAKRALHKHWMGWRRFLGFLAITEPDVLETEVVGTVGDEYSAAFEILPELVVRRDCLLARHGFARSTPICF